ncbi:MAG TPA: response regulator transcription factor [Chitinophagales bacterium]|nr:response regulator transcription factor [Chitinophagales bacterium]
MPGSKKILLIEDEVNVADFIRKGLAEEGFEVTLAFDGTAGYKLATEQLFGLIILDIMLPGKNGLDVCRDIRNAGVHTPILFLTALSTAENIALGLDMGGDDYLVKPFKFVELNARIKALLRRTDTTADVRSNIEDVYAIADLVVDDKAKTVLRNKVTISLTATEYRLLLVLIKNKGRVLSRVDLLESAWDIHFNMGTNVVDVYINYLRKKIDTDSTNKLIHTVIGMGYVLKET